MKNKNELIYKVNDLTNCITFNEFGETLKRRPVIVLKSVIIEGQSYTFYLKTETDHHKATTDFADIDCDDERLRVYKAYLIEQKILVPIDKSDFIDPTKSPGAEFIDCAKWYIMPTSQFEALYSDADQVSMLKDKAKDAIFDRLYSLYYEDPSFVSLNKVYVDDNKIKHELMYAHSDLLHNEAWIRVQNKMPPHWKAIIKDVRVRYSRYLKVKGLLPQALAKDYAEGIDYIEALSQPLLDYVKTLPKWRNNDIESKTSAIWRQSHEDLNIHS